MKGGIKSGHYGTVGRKGQGGRGDTLLEKDTLFGQPVHERRFHIGVTVTPQTVGPSGIQGDKYDIGFIVIAQRTANVSKTVLTQCNSIIAFQQFDKTSCDFLSNYMDEKMVKSLSTLKFRQACAVGRAFKSGVPVIFEVPEIKEQIYE